MVHDTLCGEDVGRQQNQGVTFDRFEQHEPSHRTRFNGYLQPLMGGTPQVFAASIVLDLIGTATDIAQNTRSWLRNLEASI
eukprot:9246763-Karenia_brevis.AAC.1